MWGSGRLVTAFAVGHIGATLVVAAGLTTAVRLGWLPVSVSRATDVGMSYGAAAVLGALALAIAPRWRPAWVGWWLAVAIAVAVMDDGDFTEVGHAVALVLGMLASTRFGGPGRWSPPRYLLLAVAALFGYLMLVDTDSALLAGVAGLLGASLAYAVGWLVRDLRAREVPDDGHLVAVPRGREATCGE
jgi:hypothetical protein